MCTLTASCFSVAYGGNYICFPSEVELFWIIRYLGSPGMRTVQPQIRRSERGEMRFRHKKKTRGHDTKVKTVVDLSACSSY